MDDELEPKQEVDEEIMKDLDVGDDAENVVGGRFRRSSSDPCEGGELA